MTRVTSLLLLVAFTVLEPTLGATEANDHASRRKDVVLYELNEQAQFTVDKKDRPHRVGATGLAGKARRGTPLCTEKLMDHAERFFAMLGITVKDASRCTVVAFGTSDLRLDTLRGTIDGQLSVVVDSERTNLSDAAELVVMTGRFDGTIEVTDPVIITITDGTFKPTGLFGVEDRRDWCPDFGICKAPFRGRFRIPFTVDHHAVYKKDDGELVRVLPNERALGEPTVRLEVTFD
jgi:hypothetical protein